MNGLSSENLDKNVKTRPVCCKPMRHIGLV